MIQRHRTMWLATMLFLSGTAVADTPPTDPLAASVQAGLVEGMRAKLAVSEHFFAKKSWPSSVAETSFTAADPNKATVTIADGGVITVEFAAPAELAGNTITHSPSHAQAGDIEWSCETTGNFPAATLPDHCKKPSP
jgi:hypothetical protein